MNFEQKGISMKFHIIAICTSIFIFCWLILGIRGLDAGIIGPGCFLAGLAVSRREQEVERYISDLKARIYGWFSSKNNPSI
jgi:hypothetical protein